MIIQMLQIEEGKKIGQGVTHSIDISRKCKKKIKILLRHIQFDNDFCARMT